MLSIAKRCYQLYRPYFGSKDQNRQNTIAGIAIIVGNIILAFALTFLNVTLNGLLGILNQPGVTYTAFFKSLASFMGALGLYGSIIAVNAWIADWLGLALSKRINKNLQKRWIKSKAYYGIKWLDSTHNEVDPAQVISHDSSHLSDQIVMLFNKLLMSLGNFVVGLIGLFTLSGSFTITLFSTPLVIPGYMALGTIIYAGACNYFTSKVGKSLTAHQTRERKVESDLYNKITHVKSHAEGIAFKKGTEYEHQLLNQTMNHAKNVQGNISNIRSALLFMTTLNSQFSSIFALILSAPSIISQKLNFSSVLEVMNHFENVVSLFTWRSNNFDEISECEVSLNQIEKFNSALKEWESIQKENNHKIERVKSQNDKFITINNLSIKKSNGSPIVTNFSAKIPKRKATLLQGASGKGKTSILRALSGLSPFATGKIEGLPENLHFIPSQPYFPYGKTLLEAIIYPRTEPASASEISEIQDLMKRLGFKQNIIDQLECNKDWYGPELSDGERQRIEIISAIIKKPEVLLMDEATARIDHDVTTKTKSKIENLLKEKLPNTTIIYTDHNPSKGKFCDNRIKIA